MVSRVNTDHNLPKVQAQIILTDIIGERIIYLPNPFTMHKMQHKIHF